MTALVLASGSSRRQQFLSDLGVTCTICVPDIDESQHPAEEPAAYVQRLATEKARAVLPLENAADVLVLGADTVVVCDGEVLGKPLIDETAIAMLQKLSGKKHEVLGGIALVRGDGSVAHSAVSSTAVYFSQLSGESIQAYVASGEPHDKAGAYAIQGLAAPFVERIEGSYTNVVGLDMAVVRSWLLQHGVLL
jgi:septum formation protein